MEEKSHEFLIGSSIFLRLMASVYFFAFWSASIQCKGLVGARGLMPCKKIIATMIEWVKSSKAKNFVAFCLTKVALILLQSSTTGDITDIQLLMNSGLAAASMCFFIPHPLLFVFLFLTYYCFKRCTGIFSNLQWDSILLESGVLCSLLAASNNSFTISPCRWLIQLLTFRLYFGSGLVKIASRDVSWRNLSAMQFHFLTQPLPNCAAPYCHSLPPVLLKFATAATLFLEIIVPITSILFQSWNGVVFLLYSQLQLSIGLTGHFGFFNYLSFVLGICFLDDDVIMRATVAMSSSLAPMCSQTISSFMAALVVPAGPLPLISWQWIVAAVVLTSCALIAAANVAAVWHLLNRTSITQVPPWTALETVHSWLSPLHVGSHYGLFATMTKIRNEIVIEVTCDDPQPPGKATTPIQIPHLSTSSSLPSTFSTSSRDGGDVSAEDAAAEADKSEPMSQGGQEHLPGAGKLRSQRWHSVEFAFKPGDPRVRPKAMWPPLHMPRLDWRMWFQALSPSADTWPEWMWALLIGVVEREADVLQLLHPTMNRSWVLDEGRPIKSVRVQLVKYEFMPRPVSLWGKGECVGDGDVDGDWGSRCDAPAPRSASISSLIGDGKMSRPSPTTALPSRCNSDDEAAHSVTGEGGGGGEGAKRVLHWRTEQVTELLPPTGIEHLYHRYDRVLAPAHKKNRPKVETVEEIIKRTLFRGLRSKP